MSFSCVHCGKKGERTNFTSIPEDTETLEKWKKKLGEAFLHKAKNKKYPLICKAHFNLEAKQRRKMNKMPKKSDIKKVGIMKAKCARVDTEIASNSQPQVPENLQPKLADIFPPNVLENMPPEMQEDEPFPDSDTEQNSTFTFKDDQLKDRDYEGDGSDIDESEESDSSSDSQILENFKFEYLICQLQCILVLLKYCKSCQKDSCRFRVIERGPFVTIFADCMFCNYSNKWENSEKCASKTGNARKKLAKLTLDLASAIYTTGASFSRLRDIFFTLCCPFFSKSTFVDLTKKYVYPAVNFLYDVVQKKTFEFVNFKINSSGSCDACGDAQFDSPGYSSMTCKYIVMDSDTKLVMHYEMKRKKQGESSGAMEPELHKIALQNTLKKFDELIEGGADVLRSLTTDRNKAVAKTMTNDFPTMIHFYDLWHMMRNLIGEITPKMKQKQFAPLLPWIKKFKNHIYYSIQSSEGNAELVKEKIAGFFSHIIGKHDHFQQISWFKFKQYKECAHVTSDKKTEQTSDSESGSDLEALIEDSEESKDEIDEEENEEYLDMTEQSDAKAWNLLWDIMDKGTRISDLSRVAPRFSTSCVESYNGRSNHYTQKSKFYSPESFDVLTKLSIIDWNLKMLDEHWGRRPVIGKRTYYCKTRKMKVHKNLKKRADMIWLRTLKQYVRDYRYLEPSSVDTEALSSEEAIDSEEENEPDNFQRYLHDDFELLGQGEDLESDEAIDDDRK